VLRAGVAQKVERLTFDLIVYLIGNRGRVVSKEELLRNVWRNMFVSDSVITQSIMKARRALGDDGEARTFIRTVHRVGYKFDEELVSSQQAAEQASGRAPQLVLIAPQASLDEAGRETLAKAAQVMARELTRLGLSVRQVDSTEAASTAADMAEHIGLALHRSLSSKRGLLVDIASRELRRTEAA
jgi:DNA-binding winged helix-turn-helix (wHTH) protein